jgi:CRISPR/Cas system CSM-associated protein Csm3 (group 7 of RAMP superfamily)
LKPTDEHGCELSKGTELRFGVGISRYREVAAEELLYTFELAPAAEAVPFRGTIEGEIPNGEGVWSVALILAALRVLSAVGGAKSRGIGWVSLNAVSVEPEVPNVKEVLEKCPMSLSVLKSA